MYQPIWAHPESGQPSQTRSRTFLKRRIPAEEKKEQETSSELFWDPPDGSSKVPTDSGVGSSANSGATSNLTLGVCEEAFVTMQASESLSLSTRHPRSVSLGHNNGCSNLSPSLPVHSQLVMLL